MKKFALLSLLFCSVLFGCEKNESETPEPDVKEGTYVGTVTVDQTDGRFFSQENVSLTVTKTSDQTIEMKMMKVKFAEEMPLTLDMTVSGIAYTRSETKTLISGDNIIPTAMGGEFPAYTITNMSGEITNEGAIRFSMKCGSFPLSFEGTAQK